MKKVLVMLALVGLMAAPAMADVVKYVTPSSAMQVVAGGPRGTPIYSDLATIGSYVNAGTTATYPLPVGDDIHAISGGTITSFAVGYYTPDAGTFNLHVAFFNNDAADSIVPPWPPGSPAPMASYVLQNLPGAGAWLITITGVSLPVGQDFWFEEDWSNSYGVAGATAVATGGPLLCTSPDPLGYGTSHDVFSQTGSLWSFSTAGIANFALEFYIPEPATIGLLAMAGLMILRRR